MDSGGEDGAGGAQGAEAGGRDLPGTSDQSLVFLPLAGLIS